MADVVRAALVQQKWTGDKDSMVKNAVAAIREICGEGSLTCRLTHVYPDGAAPYFTILAPVRRGSELRPRERIPRTLRPPRNGRVTHEHVY